jgi:hypothetical protein
LGFGLSGFGAQFALCISSDVGRNAPNGLHPLSNKQAKKNNGIIFITNLIPNVMQVLCRQP